MTTASPDADFRAPDQPAVNAYRGRFKIEIVARYAEVIAIFGMLLIFFGFFWTPLAYFGRGNEDLQDSDPFAQAANVLLLVFLLAGGLARRKEMWRALTLGWPILLVVGIAFASALWSEDPELVVRRAGVLMLSTLFGFYIFSSVGLPSLCRVLVVAFVVIAVGSFAIVAVSPGRGLGAVAGEVNAWRGAFLQKNTLGYVAGLGVIVSGYAFINRYGSRALSAAALVLTAPLTVLSASKTALLFLFAAIYIGLFCAVLRRRSARGVAAAYVLIVVAVLAIGYSILDPSIVLAAFKRDTTLSGRVDLWVDVIDAIQLRPWLGYGYGAFWRSDAFAANQIWATVGWDPPQAHNGWLELGLNLGLLGIFAVGLLWIVFAVRLMRLLVVPAATDIVLCGIIFTVNFAQNLSEADLLRQSDTVWLFFVIAFLHLKSQLQHHASSPRLSSPLPQRRVIERFRAGTDAVRL